MSQELIFKPPVHLTCNICVVIKPNFVTSFAHKTTFEWVTAAALIQLSLEGDAEVGAPALRPQAQFWSPSKSQWDHAVKAAEIDQGQCYLYLAAVVRQNILCPRAEIVLAHF